MNVNVNLFREPTTTVRAYKTKRPKMAYHRGRTWDTIGRTDKNEQIFADTTWGFYGYFQRDGKWYKFKLLAKV